MANTTNTTDTGVFLPPPSALDDEMGFMEDVWSCLAENESDGSGTSKEEERNTSSLSSLDNNNNNNDIDLLSSSVNNNNNNNNNSHIPSPAPSQTETDGMRPLSEFARSFLALSVFHMADIWGVTPEGNLANNTTVLRQDVSASSPSGSPDWIAIEYLNSIVPIAAGDGCVGKAFSTKAPVWMSSNGNDMNLALSDFHREELMMKVGIKSIFAMPVQLKLDLNHDDDNVNNLAVLSFYSMDDIPKNEQFITFMQTTIQNLPIENTKRIRSAPVAPPINNNAVSQGSNQ